MDKKWDVLGLGAVAVDDIVYVETYPPPDTKAPILQFCRQAGGLAATALVAAARQGCRTAYCGVLGEDDLSRFTLESFQREQVDCSQIQIVPGARPVVAVIIVEAPTGRRSILFSHAGLREPTPDQVTEELVAACKVLFIDHTVVNASIRAARFARSLGIPVVADIEPGDTPRLAELIAAADHLIIGENLASQLTGETHPAGMTAALATPERACSVVTAGDQGCWYAVANGHVQHFPAFPIAAVDTTGCGDVFHGAYAASLSRGESIPRAIRVATAAAGLKATQPGGQPGIPSLAVIEQFLYDHPEGQSQ